ncbi:lipoyl protein ligase domain-containing protein [Actinomarinicola tropica]|uniref:BPL/LPL catalytic domain-containing protein n=1 Tax=Actinomarinicola tropica TaxID=2789776 RepID=A0A5Q2RQT7_9ACTN|nr:hypothetical protein [Actinomarinicola tropica]QGG95555.1 hypothetical protein GH723_10865 [Actinomarinicola tropica]
MTVLPSGWAVDERRGTAGALHAAEVPTPLVPSMWVLEATAPALVLGSAQPDDDVDRTAVEARGLEVVRRRSGGGAVLVVPDACLWVDLLIPAGHDLWDEDVGRAMHWVGELWAEALGALGVAARVHRGPMVRTPWSRHVCFAGLGPGEVVDPAGRKVVGISQRRTRAWARFQTVADLGPVRQAALVDVLQLDVAPDGLGAHLTATTAAVDRDARDLVAALVAHLPG